MARVEVVGPGVMGLYNGEGRRRRMREERLIKTERRRKRLFI